MSSDNDPKGLFPDLTDDDASLRSSTGLAAMPAAPESFLDSVDAAYPRQSDGELKRLRPLPDVALVTNDEIAHFTSTHDTLVITMLTGQSNSMIPTAAVIAQFRAWRDRYEAALLAERSQGKP